MISADESSLKQRLDWNPLNQSTANFTTDKLFIDSRNRIRSRRTVFYTLFLLVFFTVGSWLLWFVTLASPVYRQGGAMFSEAGFWGDILAMVISVSFICLSTFMLLCYKEVLIEPNGAAINFIDMRFLKEEKRMVPLANVEALQLLKHYNTSSKNGYWSFEVNVVLKDLSRVNVLAHGGENNAKKDAKTLARFINKPLLSNID